MQGWSLRFYVHESQRHAGRPLYEWLLETARTHEVPGGSAFRAVAGFGRHGVLNEQHFFELAGQSTMLVEFILDSTQVDRLLGIVRSERLPLFHVRSAVEFDLVSTDA